jgi:hypothetical protein
VVLICAREIEITGNIYSGGQNGSSASGPGTEVSGGGGGAGGSILLQCQTATLGSGKITAVAGTGGSGYVNGGNGGSGSTGRIAVHHSDTVTGTTSPSYDDTTDGSLKVSGTSFVIL